VRRENALAEKIGELEGIKRQISKPVTPNTLFRLKRESRTAKHSAKRNFKLYGESTSKLKQLVFDCNNGIAQILLSLEGKDLMTLFGANAASLNDLSPDAAFLAL
jgi:hypothetical protein